MGVSSSVWQLWGGPIVNCLDWIDMCWMTNMGIVFGQRILLLPVEFITKYFFKYLTPELEVIYYWNYSFCTVARLFPVISIVNYLNCTLIAKVKCSIRVNKVFNCNRTVNRLLSATVYTLACKSLSQVDSNWRNTNHIFY